MSKAGSSTAKAATEIQLSVRIRPILNASSSRQSSVVDVVHGKVVVNGESEFGYPSHVVKGSDQMVAFDALASVLVERVCAGYNCTLMAYGQTGSGKTYTMFGPPGCLTEAAVQQAGSGSVPNTWGLFPRAVLTLMQTENILSLHASAVEVYHELVFDLLDNKTQLQIGNSRPVGNKATGKADRGGSEANARSMNGTHSASCTCHQCFKTQEANKKLAAEARLVHANGQLQAKAMSRSFRTGSNSNNNGVSVSSKTGRNDQKERESYATVGETLVPLTCAEDVACFARTIEATRTANSHLLNDRSSRSHCLVKVHVSSREEGKVNTAERANSRVSTLLFVDLAGSERMKRTGAQGIAMAEAQSINASLSALGRVIKSLGSKSTQHVPYRDASLTMLLRDSFGGKSCTSVVINIAGEQDHAEESICSLKFGERMSVVCNSPTVVIGSDAGSNLNQIKHMLEKATAELVEMRLEGLGGGFVDGAINSEKVSLMENLRKLEEAQQEVRDCITEIAEARGRGDNTASIERKLRICRPQEENLLAILGRQQTIKTLWAAPTPAFKRKAAEVKGLEGQMIMALSLS